MKNKRALLMMAVATLFGLLAVVVAASWLQRQAGNSADQVVVATMDVNRGQRLTPDMLKLEQRALQEVPKGAFSERNELSERVLKANVLKGEVLSEAMLAPPGTMGGLSALIGEGKRAITVRVNDVIGVAGFALPGNYVDIIVHTQRELEGNSAGLRPEPISKIVLERILVLAVAQEVSRDETKPKVVNAVTLEVTPEQAENLDLARGVGTLSLALRNQVDITVPATGGATKFTLLDEMKPAAPLKPKIVRVRHTVGPGVAAAPVKRDCVSVLNGLQSAQECF